VLSSLAAAFLAIVARLMLATASGFVTPATPQLYALALRAGNGHEYWRTVATSEHRTLVCSVP
jgi:hypothetical protein